MRRFIFGERNGIYIVDLHQTLDRIDTAYRFVRDTVADGGTRAVRRHEEAGAGAGRAAGRARRGMPYVNFRWLGGMLTNFQTVHCTCRRSCASCSGMVDSGEIDQMPKKEGLKVRRDLAKLDRNLGGIKNLEKLPSVVFVIDTKKEHIAVTEANRLQHPGRRGRRHQLRPRHHRLRDPRQRRRDPLRAADVPRDRRRGDEGREHPAAAQRAPGTRAEDAAAAAAAAEARSARPRKRPSSRSKQAEARAAAAAQAEARSRSGPGRRRREAGRSAAAPNASRRGRADGRRARRDRRRRPTTDRATGDDEQWLTSPQRTSRRCARSPAPG